MSLCNGGIHSSNVQSLFSGRTGRNVVGGLILVSPFHEGTACFTGSELLNAAASRAAFCFVLYLLLVGPHGLSSQRLYLLPPGAVWHSSQQSLPAFRVFIGCLHGFEPQRQH